MASIKYKTEDGYVSIPMSIQAKTNEENGNGIGTCSTSSGTALTVSLTGYELVQNGFVAVTFANDVPANATLNINSKGAKPIYYKGSAITADTIKADDTVMFCYNGSQYVVTSLGGESGGGEEQKQQPPIGVYIEDVFGNLYSSSSWDSTKIVNSIVVSTQDHCFRMAPIMLSMPLWIAKSNGQGGSISISTSDLNVFAQYPTAEQAATCFSGEEDTYKFNKLYSSKQNTVDMAYILGDAPVFCYNYKFNRGGNGYLMSAGEAMLIHSNITDINAAYTAIGRAIGNPNFWTSTYCGTTSRGLDEFWVSNRGTLSIGGYFNNVCSVIPLGRYY